MTTPPRARNFRIRRSGSLSAGGAATPRAAANAQPAAEAQDTAEARGTARSGQVDSAAQVRAETDIDAIRREGLTGRQLRMARRVAQKHGLAPTSDFDAVRQLRQRGIDPFDRSKILELVVPKGTDLAKEAQSTAAAKDQNRIQLPQTVPAETSTLPSTAAASPARDREAEISRIQRDIARRRKVRLAMLFSRLAVFVLLPTLIAGVYFYRIATPMYAAHSQFVVQQAEPQGAPGLGGLFQGTGLAVQQDSTGVQAFLQSRDAMRRLDAELGFVAHFSNPEIDTLQRLDPDATLEDAYGIYQDRVTIGFDPTEGILKMEVVAADPAAARDFSRALIRYAEERVDEQTLRVREDQMRGARQSFEEAQARRQAALSELTAVQQDVQSIDPAGEVASLLQQITTLETQRTDKELEIAAFEAVRRPNQARLDAARGELERLNAQVTLLRNRMSEASASGASLSEIQGRLRQAEENYSLEVAMVQAAQQAMETARIEANRQVRYLSLNVEPVAPDKPSYPKAFENTFLTFLILSGVYLMISLTASILREQVSS